MAEEARSVNRKVKAGTLELDPEEAALVISCFVETTISSYGETVSKERKAVQKILPVPVPLSRDECLRLADEIVKSCKYILKSQQPLVERLMYQLHQRCTLQDDQYTPGGEGEDVSMDNLETYLEMLYEGQDDMKEKIKGTQMILQLAQDAENLEVLIQDHTLMGALSRVLYDEHRKSMELAYNIARIFLAFSNFIEMHDILANYKVGSLTMKVVEMELKKAEHRDEERKRKLEGGASQGDRPPKDGTQSAGSGSRDSSPGKPKKLERASSSSSSHRDEGKAKVLMKKQDKLLFVCLYILLNLATDENTERKMVKKNLTEFLVCLLDRVSYDLILLVVTFLKKISIYDDNLAVMKQSDVVAKLVRLIPCSHDRLIDTALRLLFNLSFDSTMREQMVKFSLIPKLVELLKKPAFRGKVLRLLYQLSVDDRCKSMFTYTEAIPIVKELVINFPRNLLTQELAALAINLTWNGRNAELMCQKGGLKRLMDRMLEKKDPLLMKVIRNISNWTLNNQFDLNDPVHEYRYRSLWPPHVKSLISLALETDNNDQLVEALGTLASLTPLDLPLGSSWTRYLEDYDLLSVCKRLLVPGMAQNDIVLEVVMLMGALALDPSTASDIANSGIIRSLHEVLSDKGDDSEIVVQVLYTLYRLLRHPETRDTMLYVEYKDKKDGVQQTRIVMDIMEMLHHRNPEVRRTADLCMDLVLEVDRGEDGHMGDLGSQIRRNRFTAHNQEWCDIVAQEEQMVLKDGFSTSKDSPSSQGSREVDWASHMLHGEKVAMRMSDLGLSMTRSRMTDTDDDDHGDEDDDDDDEVPPEAEVARLSRWSSGGSRGDSPGPGGKGSSWDSGRWSASSPAY